VTENCKIIIDYALLKVTTLLRKTYIQLSGLFLNLSGSKLFEFLLYVSFCKIAAAINVLTINVKNSFIIKTLIATALHRHLFAF